MNQPHYKELKDKVVVITGGGGVLGSALALSIANQGTKVAIIDLKEEAAQEIAKKINANGGSAIGVGANVLQKESLIKARNIIKEQWGSCDILINGAGGNHPKGTTTKTHFFEEDLNPEDLTTFFTLDPKGIQFVFDLNFIGTLLPTQVFAEDMVGKEGTAVLNISSMNAFRPLTKIPAYSAAKAAVSNFTQWLAVHLAPVGVRVNAIAPGFFLTDQNRSLLTQKDGSLTPRGTTILEHTPMNRFGEPDDLVGTVLWLMGNGSKFVTGIVVPIDGGFSAYSGV
jgi:NAD(P)-dependent dehydrogenase (short-subunit alcohol dehydrogenase family)